MFDRILGKKLVLVLDNRELSFASVVDFEFCLAGRTELPASKLLSLKSLSARELKEEATRIREIEKRFVGILAESLETPESIGRSLLELGDKVFSKDHQWRAIVASLNAVDTDRNEYKKLALVKYLQYLGSRQDALKTIYVEKLSTGVVAAGDNAASNELAFKETIIFDLSDLHGTPADTGRFERLPKGETVAIHLQPGRKMEFMLSNNRFRLVPGSSFIFIDERGADCKLKSGKNVIGRDSKSEVVINSRYRDVSRTHLIIEPFGPDTALFTDLSSHGTYVPIRNLHADLRSH